MAGCYLQADRLTIAIAVDLREEGCSESWIVEFVEFVVNETQEDTALANTRIAKHNHLNLPLLRHLLNNNDIRFRDLTGKIEWIMNVAYESSFLRS